VLARILRQSKPIRFWLVTLAGLLDRMIASRISTSYPSAAGCLLVASPSWQEPSFARSVCLVVHHSPEGAIGVILNRQLSMDGNAILKYFGGESARGKLYLGGPNSGPVVAMHQRQDLAEFESGDGVYFAAQADLLKRLMKVADCPWRIIVGQVGWAAGELDQQIQQGNWLPLNVTARIAFADEDQMWPVALRQIGNHWLGSLVGINSWPADISVN
jgi:putative transcriptional regulator